VADYSEFPTTPTGWQERQAQEWETVLPLSTEESTPPRRSVDLTALVPGVIFIVLAIALLAGVELPHRLWDGGGLLWILLIGGGVFLLLSELRKARRRR
jgi:hypothetical protein